MLMKPTQQLPNVSTQVDLWIINAGAGVLLQSKCRWIDSTDTEPAICSLTRFYVLNTNINEGGPLQICHRLVTHDFFPTTHSASKTRYERWSDPHIGNNQVLLKESTQIYPKVHFDLVGSGDNAGEAVCGRCFSYLFMFILKSPDDGIMLWSTRDVLWEANSNVQQGKTSGIVHQK